MYVDLYHEMRPNAQAERENINDDLVFEIELVKQVEVNVDYILMLVEERRAERGDGDDKEIPVDIRRAVDSSPSLYNKRDLIFDFVDAVSLNGNVTAEWKEFISRRRIEELKHLIAAENLKEVEAQSFASDALRMGYVSEEGTAITRILPPLSRFAKTGGAARAQKKQRIIEALRTWVDRFGGLGIASDDLDDEQLRGPYALRRSR